MTIYGKFEGTTTKGIGTTKGETFPLQRLIFFSIFSHFTRCRYCSGCKEHVPATKTITLARLPAILIIHLKRFEYNNIFQSEKINTLIDYPINGLNMSEHCIRPEESIRCSDASGVTGGEQPVYDLYAVSNHFGRMGMGHYTAHCRTLNSNSSSSRSGSSSKDGDKENEGGEDTKWYTLDDSRCYPCREEDVVSQSGYVLFYQLRQQGSQKGSQK